MVVLEGRSKCDASEMLWPTDTNFTMGQNLFEISRDDNKIIFLAETLQDESMWWNFTYATIKEKFRKNLKTF